MKILILEDENAAARRLEKLLSEINPTLQILDTLDSIESAVNWLNQHPAPDLILQDIHLADGNSFEIFKHTKVTAPVIFTTAYDEFALQAFKVNAVDYLLKPIKKEELAAALEKFQHLQASTQAPAQSPTQMAALLEAMRKNEPQHVQRMLIKFGHSIKLVEMADAAYFYTRDKITFLVARSTGKRFPIDHPLDKLETLLDPRQFFRINRQFIINMAAIREMHPYSKSRVKVDLEPASDMETIVSTERSGEFKRWLVGELANEE